jgi:hypothetical protein
MSSAEKLVFTVTGSPRGAATRERIVASANQLIAQPWGGGNNARRGQGGGGEQVTAVLPLPGQGRSGGRGGADAALRRRFSNRISSSSRVTAMPRFWFDPIAVFDVARLASSCILFGSDMNVTVFARAQQQRESAAADS